MKIILMLILVLSVSVLAQDREAAHIEVHEWGVVLFDEQGTGNAGGVPFPALTMNPVDDLIEPIEVEAPVVWFHGPYFTGTFRVSTETGSLKAMYPYPDHIETAPPSPDDLWEQIVSVEWTGLSVGSSFTETEEARRISYAQPYQWAMNYWRTVPANWIYRQGDGIQERFIYYECSISGDFPCPLIRTDDGFAFEPGYSGEGLIFIPGGEYSRISLIELTGTLRLPEGEETRIRDPDYAKQVIFEWAGGMLRTEEIDAFWSTWESTLTDTCPDGASWLLFPLPNETVEAISTIELIPNESWLEVRYERLFLGLVKIGS